MPANPLAQDAYPQDAKKECCFNCRFYDDGAGLCRYNPPAGPNWAKISQPYVDWCSKWGQGNIQEARMLQPPTTRVSGTGGVK